MHITFLFILNALICPLTVLVIGSFLMYMNFRVFNNILKLIEAYLAFQRSIPKQTWTMLNLPRQQSLYRGSCSMWVHIWHLVTTTTQTYLFIFNYKHIWLKMAIIYISNAAFAAFIKKQKKKIWIKLEIQHAEITMNILSLFLWQDVQLLNTFTMTFYQKKFLLLSSF